MDRIGLINYLELNGKRKEESWLEIAEKFNVGIGLSDETKAKKCNDIWRSYQKKEENNLTEFQSQAKIKTMKKWQDVSGIWRTSIAYEKPITGFNSENFKKELINSIKEYEYPQLKLKYNTFNEIAALINISDAHIDKLTLTTETGFGSKLEDNVKVFTEKFDEMLTTAIAFNPELIIFPINGDFFNTNDSRNTTKRGTPQDVSVKHHDAFKTGLTLIRQCIDKASQVAKVYVPIIRGNHDEDAIYYLGTTLEAIYEGHSNVIIQAERRSRKYIQYGKSLIGFAHGDLEKPDQLPLIMAEEQKEAWSNTNYRFWFLGDKHHTKEYLMLRSKDYVGAKVTYLRSITPTDNWHSGAGYIGVPKTTNLILFDIEKGEKANFSFNV